MEKQPSLEKHPSIFNLIIRTILIVIALVVSLAMIKVVVGMLPPDSY